MPLHAPTRKKNKPLTDLIYTDLFGKILHPKKVKKKARNNPHLMPHMVDLSIYDRFIVMLSGGKDSIASLLYLLDRGVDRSKIEIWHHLIDGREGSDLMDWPCTEDYCRKLAASFGLPIYFSWKKGGFEGEMTRLHSRTAPTLFEDEHHIIRKKGGTDGKNSTRMIFPQVSANLRQRWCSSYLKIMVASMAITNQKRFINSKTLVVTGERGEESANRTTYEVFEPHVTDLRHSKKAPRHVDHFRPVLDLSERQVWDMLETYLIRPHPAYLLGYGRVSCLHCIFGNDNQFASGAVISSGSSEKLAGYERQFALFHHLKYARYTLKRQGSIPEMIRKGTPYKEIALYPAVVAQARAKEYTDSIFMPPGEWILPAGAFSKQICGAA